VIGRYAVVLETYLWEEEMRALSAVAAYLPDRARQLLYDRLG
jgi:hypothetical protein